MNGTQPWPVPANNIPSDHCDAAFNLNSFITGNIVTLSWNTPHDNDGFYISYWKGTGAVTTKVISGLNARLVLEPQTAYNWSVILVCDQVADRKAGPVLGVPFITSTIADSFEGDCSEIEMQNLSTIVSSNVARMQWDPISGVNDYDVIIRENGMPTAIVFNTCFNYFNYLFGNSGSNYTWAVKPNCLNAKYSDPVPFSILVQPSAPLIPKSKVTDSSALIRWNFNSKQDGFLLFVDNILTKTVEGSINFTNINCLNPGTTYNIVILPKYSGVVGEPVITSITTLGVQPPVPENLTVTLNGLRANINWSIAPNTIADNFIVWIGGTSFNIRGNQTSIVFDVQPNIKYNVAIRSILNGLKSNWAVTSIAPITNVASPILDIVLKSVTYHNATVQWDHMAGIDFYTLTIRESGTFVISVPVNTSFTYFDFENLDPAKSYIVTISGNKSGITPTTGSIIITTPLKPAGPVPNGIAVSNVTDTSFDISYDLNPNVETNFFRIDLYLMGDTVPFANITTEENHLTISGLSPNTSYFFTVNNIWNNINVLSSAQIPIKTLYSCVPPANIVAQFVGDDLHITWDIVTNNHHYKLKIWSPDDAAMIIPITTPGDVLIIGLRKGVYFVSITNYYYAESL